MFVAVVQEVHVVHESGLAHIEEAVLDVEEVSFAERSAPLYLLNAIDEDLQKHIEFDHLKELPSSIEIPCW